MQSATVSPRMQNEVRSHGMNVERLSLRVVRENGTAMDAMQRAQDMYESVMQKVDARYQPTYACKPGCTHCCSAPVRVSSPEVELLVRHVKQNLSPEQLEALKARIRAVLAERRAGGRPRCAFLGNDDLCTVYSIRPMMCRACNSDDVDPCKRWAEGGDETSSLRVFMLPRLYAMVTVAGVLKGLQPHERVDSARQAELMETLLPLL